MYANSNVVFCLISRPVIPLDVAAALADGIQEFTTERCLVPVGPVGVDNLGPGIPRIG